MMIMTRKYGNMGISMQKLADAAGVRRSTVESCVRLLEPIIEEMDKMTVCHQICPKCGAVVDCSDGVFD